jgi:hypothetical protein
MRVIVMCKSHDVERVQDAGDVCNTSGNENGSEGGKKGYIYSSSCDFLVQLVLLVTEYRTAQSLSYTTTRHLMNEEHRD